MQLVNENIFEWIVALVVTNSDSIYNGGYFKAKMTFPKNYPYSPPGKPPFSLTIIPRYLTVTQTSSSSVRSSTRTFTPMAGCVSPSSTRQEKTRCPASSPRSVGLQHSASSPS